MQKIVLVVALTFLTSIAWSQTSKDYAVLLQVEVTDSPASITIKWPADNSATSYRIFRKSLSTDFWGNALQTLSNTATSYTDNAIETAKTYEYYVQRLHSGRTAHGYVCAGIKVPPMLERGEMLLLVDDNYRVPLAAEIDQLKWDLIKDGWWVNIKYIARNLSAAAVKQIILQENIKPLGAPQLQAVYVLGRVPVPYSGGFVAQSGQTFPPDGHTEHGGAWATDMYYAYLNESFWTDSLVNDTTPARAVNDNIPGDGKFDQMFIANNKPNLQVGRVDLFNMPVFGQTDTALVRQYLQKAHKYKIAETPVIRRALVDDNFGAMSGEAFAASGWRNFSTMFGDSVEAKDYLTSTKQGNYLFTYGCGAGSYTSCSGVATTAQFNNDSINQIFTMLFGSYFGDWDAQNNLLRAPLATKNGGLASAWSGRPHWHFHHMALGYNIGYSAKLTQGNVYDDTTASPVGYVHNKCSTFISTNLMGDPSLRLHMREPVSSFTASTSSDSMRVSLSWQLVSGAVNYVISKASSLNNGFIASVTLSDTATTWVDVTPFNGYTKYMIRPVFVETTPSGTYLNTALGTVDSAYSKNTTLATKNVSAISFSMYPNPAKDQLHISLLENENGTVTIIDITGKTVMQVNISTQHDVINLSSLGRGIYFVNVQTAAGNTVKKLVKE
jgi:hypothetical protein